MKADKSTKLPIGLEGLKVALASLDKQVERDIAVWRSDSTVSRAGAQAKRIESYSVFLLDLFSSRDVSLDSLAILSAATLRALSLLVSDLGAENIGSSTCADYLQTFSLLERDLRQARAALIGETTLN